MRRIALTSTFVISLLVNAAMASGQTKVVWITKEFTDPAGVPVAIVESFLNDTCQPSGLDGIQILSVQRGETESPHLHVYCRQDKASSVHYKVTMPVIASGSVFGAVMALIPNPNVRIGPFYFGKERAQDSFVLIEKIR